MIEKNYARFEEPYILPFPSSAPEISQLDKKEICWRMPFDGFKKPIVNGPMGVIDRGNNTCSLYIRFATRKRMEEADRVCIQDIYISEEGIKHIKESSHKDFDFEAIPDDWPQGTPVYELRG